MNDDEMITAVNANFETPNQLQLQHAKNEAKQLNALVLSGAILQQKLIEHRYCTDYDLMLILQIQESL